jgi:hypothetical protein
MLRMYSLLSLVDPIIVGRASRRVSGQALSSPEWHALGSAAHDRL